MRLIIAVLTTIAGIIAFMLQTGPKEAASRASEWWALVGTPPQWIKAPFVDSAGTVVFSLIALIGASLLIWLWLKRTSKARVVPRTQTGNINFKISYADPRIAEPLANLISRADGLLGHQ